MTNTTKETRVVRMFAREGDNELHIDADSLRRLAELADMVGGTVKITCPKGFTGEGQVHWVEYNASQTTPFICVWMWDGEKIGRRGLCSECMISPVVDLGTVTP